MANPIIVIIAVAMVAMIIYGAYTVFLSKPATPTGSGPISTIVLTSIPQSSSNTVNSITEKSMWKGANVIMIYENDFRGQTSDHYLSPSVVDVIANTRVSFLIVNNGVVPHSFEIQGNYLNVSLAYDILPGQNAMLNFTVPLYGNYTMFSQHPGDQALGLNGIMVVVYNGST